MYSLTLKGKLGLCIIQSAIALLVLVTKGKTSEGLGFTNFKIWSLKNEGSTNFKIWSNEFSQIAQAEPSPNTLTPFGWILRLHGVARKGRVDRSPCFFFQSKLVCLRGWFFEWLVQQWRSMKERINRKQLCHMLLSRLRTCDAHAMLCPGYAPKPGPGAFLVSIVKFRRSWLIFTYADVSTILSDLFFLTLTFTKISGSTIKVSLGAWRSSNARNLTCAVCC